MTRIHQVIQKMKSYIWASWPKTMKAKKSGCSKHMVEDASKFIHISPKNSRHVTCGDSNKGKILGVGKNRYESLYFCKKMFLLVDGLKHNLLSIHQLCDKGFLILVIVFDEDLQIMFITLLRGFLVDSLT